MRCACPRTCAGPGAAEKVVQRAVEHHGRLDGVVFAAGAVAFGAATETPDQVLVDLFTLNTLAPIRLLRAHCRTCSPRRPRGGSPFVVHISAVVAETPMPGMAGYSASKAGLAAFDAAAARELRRSRIRLIDARPPHTETGLADRPLSGTAPRLPHGLDPEASPPASSRRSWTARPTCPAPPSANRRITWCPTPPRVARHRYRLRR